MPNIAQVLKEEIAHIARKQSRADTATLKRAVAKQRSDIAALKKQVTELARQLVSAKRRAVDAPMRSAEPETRGLRFSSKGLASHRRRLGLSAAALGRMFGVSGQTIYLWESGKARPRAKHMPAMAALRSIGRRQAAEVLARLP
jgi:DNA-binding transcriptional regulator YiaG